MFFNFFSLNSIIPVKLNTIPSQHLKHIAGGNNNNNNADIAYVPLPGPLYPTSISQPIPISGYIAANDDGSKVGLKYQVNDYLTISTTVTNNYDKIVDYGFKIQARYDF